LDFKEWETVYEQGDAWVMLPHAVESADRILNSLDECNYPTLQARWTLYVMLQHIREAAEALEKHIAGNGLWLSEDEWAECDSYDMPTLWIDDRRKAG
jgi:hypothetical protein